MTLRRTILFLVGALLLLGAARALGRPRDDGTAAEVILSKPAVEWVRVYEDGRFGAVYRFRRDGVLERTSGGTTSWRTWEIRDGRLLLNGKTPCEITNAPVIRGDDEGPFVLVPRSVPGMVPQPEPARRLTIRIFVDGKDTVFVRGDRLWLKHEADKLPGTDDGRGPTWVNGGAWSPTWASGRTRPFEGLDPPLPTAGEPVVWIARTEGRGPITVNEVPGPENDYVLCLTIDDALPGANWYEIAVTW